MQVKVMFVFENCNFTCINDIWCCSYAGKIDVFFCIPITTSDPIFEEISEISEEHVESIYTGETSEEGITSEEIDFQIKEEEVILNNYSENKSPQIPTSEA